MRSSSFAAAPLPLAPVLACFLGAVSATLGCGAEPDPRAARASENAANPRDGATPDGAALDGDGRDGVAPLGDPIQGRMLFERAWSKDDAWALGGDGLGPAYNASSCVACHAQGGVGGSGGNHANVVVLGNRVQHRHGSTRAQEDRAIAMAALRQLGLLAPSDGAAPLNELLPGTDSGGTDFGTPSAGTAIGTSGRDDDIMDGRGPAFALAPGGVHVQGARARSLVTRVVRRAFSPLHFCLTSARAPILGRHTIHLAWRITAAGAVEDARASVVGVATPAGLTDCFRTAVSRLQFGAARGASEVTVPITFRTTVSVRDLFAPAARVERNTPALFGDGLIDAIDDEVIEAAADTPVAGHLEISGRVGHTREGLVTRFGWKGDVPDLVTFVTRACAVELGLDTPGAPQAGSPKEDLALDDVDDLIAFVRALPRPVEARDARASAGAERFDAIGCTGCHLAVLGDVDGLYSDLLLHDMGAELADGAGSYGGSPLGGAREWRTPPLWGVRDSAPYLHDGRARTLEDAIALHGGEATSVRAGYDALSEAQRAEVVAFLESLRAP
jgi:CxxC motif-containing protein (DUF1111 family)